MINISNCEKEATKRDMAAMSLTPPLTVRFSTFTFTILPVFIEPNSIKYCAPQSMVTSPCPVIVRLLMR